MKLKHDIEHDLEHTIPPEGGPDSQWLFRTMTERSLAWIKSSSGRCFVDLASGMGQDTLAIADPATSRRFGDGNSARRAAAAPPLVIGIEPSDRMIRFGKRLLAGGNGRAGTAPPAARFVRGLGEEIPLRDDAVDALLCKGALDHFMDPSLTLAEIGRVLKPGGLVVVALANYDSLSCRLGRWLDRGPGKGVRRGHATAERPYYEPPPDHLTRFAYLGIVSLPNPPLKIRRIEGLSLLWGFPPWGRLLGKVPTRLRRSLLRFAYVVARLWPAWADVIVVVAEKPRGTPRLP